MAIFTPIRLDRLQVALVSVFESALAGMAPAPEVHWSKTAPSYEGLPAATVALRMIGGPTPFLRSRKRGTLLNPSTSIDITIASVVVGARYVIRLNWYDYFTDAVGGDTVTTIRDRLSALISASPTNDLEPVTPSSVGADAVRLTADFNGAMRSLEIFGPLTSGANVVSDTSVLLTDGTQRMLVNVQGYTKNREPRNGAPAVASTIYAATQTESFVETLTRSGIGVWNRGALTDLSVVSGGRWEDRGSFDLTLAMRAAWVEDVERIESAVVTLTASGVTTEQTITL